MLKTILTYVGILTVIVVVGVAVHYFGGLDWPWAISIGAAAAVRSVGSFAAWGLRARGRPRLTGGG